MTDATLDLIGRQTSDPQSVGHVLEHRHMRVKRIVLKNHRNIALGGFERVDDTTVDPNLASRDVLEACHHAQQGAFAAP